MADQIRTDLTDRILTITLDRPDAMNAFTAQMMHETIAAFDRADADDEVRAVIVTGAGDRAFCAGADLSGGAATFDYAKGPRWSDAGSPVRADGSVDYDHPGVRDGGGMLSLRIFQCLKPVIGAINGAAVGIGATMTLPMDFRLAVDTARFGFVFAKRGIVPEAASSWFLPRLVGISTALDWCYSGRLVSAVEAREAGLVRSVHAPGYLIHAARDLAQQLTAQSAPVSVALTRQMLWRMMGAPSPIDAHRLDSRLVWSRGSSADAREGIASFLEKRAADYPDKVSADLPHFSPWLDELEW
ncbi:crotonase/enoyl-CoA hydratase family protein [Sphingomonas bacterium]|uniref:crotonase/enoyl-CoA hydratase family protein n=1 Tax=Sphingomonas bacterium TaxID=1895847 RepID=UPI002601AD4B|nr:crotonase/enoyl-CoA hydratase family protein [Sphingomonas bacterium]MDB5679812.1 enoyl-CoA hydratase [Sphingomonas bacterium]